MSHARVLKRELPITEPGRLRAALRDLGARERRILELRYGIDEVSTQSLRQIGRRFGISSERVRQIQAKALRKLEGNGQMQAGKPVGGAKRVGGAETLPRTALQAWTLELLRHEPGHGYDLLRRLDWPKDELGPRLYRLLRELEDSGLVRSDWADNADGPERRVYQLTAKGGRQLRDDAQKLHRLSQSLQRFFEHYAEDPGFSSGSARSSTARRG